MNVMCLSEPPPPRCLCLGVGDVKTVNQLMFWNKNGTTLFERPMCVHLFTWFRDWIQRQLNLVHGNHDTGVCEL